MYHLCKKHQSSPGDITQCLASHSVHSEEERHVHVHHFIEREFYPIVRFIAYIEYTHTDNT